MTSIRQDKYSGVTLAVAPVKNGQGFLFYDQEDVNTRKAKLKEILAFSMSRRQIAVQAGAKSAGDKSWAVAAACESWLLSILKDSPEDVKRVEIVIDRLINRV